MKRALVVAGPNGAGKTTYIRRRLAVSVAPHPVFVNADLAASALDPFSPERAAIAAGRSLLREIEARAARGEDFIFETTLAGRAYMRRIREWRAIGYVVSLHFLLLPDPTIAVSRVAARVSRGGHHVPETVIRRRFVAGWRNFRSVYRSLVDDWAVFDNAGPTPILIEQGGRR